jgi:tetratricopeptide (TPR) repeat protein
MPVPTLRSSVSRFLLGVQFVAAACTLTSVGLAADAASPPRTLMRLPNWIESFGNEPHSTEQVQTIADWEDDSVTPVAAPPAKPAATKPAASASSGFRRWINERVATLPKPADLLPTPKPNAQEPSPGAAAAEPVAGAAATSDQQPAVSVSTPVATTPDEMPTLSVDPASFRGALPGRTTRKELETGWGAGEPFTAADGTGGLAWKIDPFDRVEVVLDGDTVASIRIKLAEAVALEELARQLEIGDLRTVAVKDEQGAAIGQVYPERGVILSLEAGTTSANAILIEPLSADSFVLRAEGELDTCSAYAVADLQQAIQIDPRNLRAHRLLLATAGDQGQWLRALELAEKAGAIDPTDVWTKLKHAGVLLALDRPQEARAVVDAVKSLDNASPLVVAQSARLGGRISLANAQPDHQAAVEQFAEAIRRAAPLLTKRSPGVQAAAREVLLDAHLGTALAIAKGTWQQKSRVIPKWIARAENLVKEFKGPEAETQVLELQLCRGALAVAAGSSESIEPLPWVKRLLELRDRMGETVSDPWRRRQIDWETGQGLADALTAAQKRGDATDMLDNATLTAAYLERGAERRELTAAERKNIGELMFRIGILHSLQRGDHATAVTWFDRTVPLWSDNDRFERDGELGRLGEAYVSMAISYWQVDRRDDAVTLSRRGVDLMVAAVDKQQLDERALAVAYGNLATMYAEQGDEAKSKNYAEMASRAEASGNVIR